MSAASGSIGGGASTSGGGGAGAGAAASTPPGAAGAPREPVVLKSPFQARKTDVFDVPDFDATRFINQIYPDEASLGDLDRFIEMLRKQVAAADREVIRAVRAQSGSQARSRQDLGAAHAEIAELAARVREVQRRAADSEGLAQDICRDIRRLDCAKRNLTHAITSLRRLAMLTAAVQDLEQAGHRRDQYRRCANLLEAVSQLLEHFDAYADVPRIQALRRRLAVVQATLTDAVLDDFRMLLGASDVAVAPETAERLAAACLVVDALGPKVRDRLMDWLCEREMTVYQTVFSLSATDASKLDRFERRFAWFKQRLDERRDVWAVFPPAWRVPQVLCLTFCKITKAVLKRLLSDGEEAVRADVGPLIKTVVATNKFEREMAALFGGGGGGAGGESGAGAGGDGDDDALMGEDGGGAGGGGGSDSLPASEARRRLEAFRRKQQAAAVAKEQQQAAAAAAGGSGGAAGAEAGAGAAAAAGGAKPGEAAAAAAAARVAFEGAISDAFEDSLRHYVAEEQKELLRHLDALIREEHERGWRPPEELGQDAPGAAAGTRVLASANALFLKIRGSLGRCVRLVSRGPTLLGLAGAFKRVLAAYAGELLRRLPKTQAGGTSAQPPLVGTDWHVRLPEEEEAVLLAILATAEHCRETTEGLARLVAKELRPAALAQRLDLGDEEADAFVGVASQCLSVLVLGVTTRLEPCLQEMLRVRWDALESPGDCSAYVAAMRHLLVVDAAPRLGAALDRGQLEFFLDKLARTLVPRFVEHVHRLRRVSEKGALQLAIDADGVRRLLLELPRAARPLDGDAGAGAGGGAGAVAGSYQHYVEREMGGAINLVKVLQAKPESLVDTFMLLMPAGARAPADLARVCELKGLTKKLAGELVAQYARKLGAAGGDVGGAGGGGGAGGAGGAPVGFGGSGGGFGSGGGGGGGGASLSPSAGPAQRPAGAAAAPPSVLSPARAGLGGGGGGSSGQWGGGGGAGPSGASPGGLLGGVGGAGGGAGGLGEAFKQFSMSNPFARDPSSGSAARAGSHSGGSHSGGFGVASPTAAAAAAAGGGGGAGAYGGGAPGGGGAAAAAGLKQVGLNLQQTAARTREGLAKIGGLNPFIKLGGGGQQQQQQQQHGEQ